MAVPSYRNNKCKRKYSFFLLTYYLHTLVSQIFGMKGIFIFSLFRSFNPVFIFIVGYLFLADRQTIANPLTNSPAGKVREPSLNSKDVPETINVSKFKIIGNRVIPQADIDAILKPYLYRPISFAELLEVQEAVTQLFIDRGYFTTGAYIPPQTMSDRTIEIEIIEGRISEIRILGLKKLNPEYIRSRIAIASEPPVHRERLFEALQLLQLNPLVDKLSAELSDGVDPGENYLKLTVTEADSRDVTLKVENNGATSAGTLKGKIELEDRNFFGFGDTLRVGYGQTEGSRSLDRLEYLTPIGARGTLFRFLHSRSDNQIIAEPFPPLDLESENRDYNFTLIQSAIQSPSTNLYFTLGFNYHQSQFTLMDLGFPDLARGLDEEGRNTTSTLVFSQELSHRTTTKVIAAASQFSVGIDAFDSTINTDAPDSQYFIWRGFTNYRQVVGENSILNLKGIVQLSNDALYSHEQFLIGGVSTVRGYSRDVARGDNGILTSIALNQTVLQISDWDLDLIISPFFDFGRVWNSDDLPTRANTLASLGIETELAIDDKINLSVAIGIPLFDDKLPEGNSLQEKGIHFSLSVKPF